MEEVSLLSAEMMHVTQFFTCKAGDWDSKTNTEGGWGVTSEVRIEGYTTYAK